MIPVRKTPSKVPAPPIETASANICERRHVGVCHEKSDGCCDDWRNKRRNGNSNARYRLSEEVAGDRNDDRGNSSRAPYSIFEKEIQREKSGYESAADVYGDDCPRPIGYYRYNVAHAKKINNLPRPDLAFGQLCERDVEITADQRGKQQKQRRTRAKAKFAVGVLKHLDLYKNHDENEQAYQKQKKRQRERKILKLVHCSEFLSARREQSRPMTSRDETIRYSG